MRLLCNYCHTGKLELRKLPYIQWHEKNLIIVDRIPALICDTCGDKSYDPNALENLQRLLWSNLTHRSSATPAAVE
jgi:YgiT-type zinc finger domain-containing protein